MLPAAMPTTTAARPPSEEAAHPRTGPNSPAAGRSTDAAKAVSLATDEFFHLLQNSRRRAVIRYLQGHEGRVRMRDVAEQVAAWEHDTTVARLTSTERQRVHIALYQSHLDALADAGVIAYNKPRGVIEPQPLLEQVASYLDRVGIAPPEPATDADTDAAADPWPDRYLGAVVGSTLLLAGAALDLPVFELVPSVAVGVVILLLFTGLTVAELVLDGDEVA